MDVRYLFVDMNAYFASCEQQLRPELRNRAIAVAPMDTDRTCCIAASYEAKAFGIGTGTPVSEARRLCPGLSVVLGRPEEYIVLHHKIVQAVESCLHVDAVHSIDEMSCRLLGRETQLDQAVQMGIKVQRTIAQEVGQYMRCSVGLAPNRFLSKVASDMQKPNGLTVITRSELPHKLYSLKLDDFPGIAKQMLKRLNHAGIRTVPQLCALSEQQMHHIWQSVLGSVWWHNLRGDDLPEQIIHRRQVGHSRVLAPELRNMVSAHTVMIRLIHKAAARLRYMKYWARQMSIHVQFYNRRYWKTRAHLGIVQDTQTLVSVFNHLWARCPKEHTPLKVGVTLHDLLNSESATLPLLAYEQKRVELWEAIDRINARFGTNTVYLAAMHHARHAAPIRIAFQQIPDLKLNS